LVRRSPDKSAQERLRENLEFYEIFKHSGDSKKDLLKVSKTMLRVILTSILMIDKEITCEADIPKTFLLVFTASLTFSIKEIVWTNTLAGSLAVFLGKFC